MTKLNFPHAHHISQRFNYRKAFCFDHEEDHTIKRHEKPIFLHYGLPHDGFFPVDSMQLQLVDEPFQTYNDSDKKPTCLTIPRHANADAGSSTDLATCLQYCSDFGVSKLEEIITEIVAKTHPPAFSDWDKVVSFGTGDGVYKVFDLLLDPGDTVLVEQFTFVPTLSSITTFGAQLVPVMLDLYNDGIDVKHMQHQLVNWHTLHPGVKFPKCLYTIPTGHNPIGTTQTLETRKQIYALCDAYDIIIVEDDPYGCLALSKYNEANPFTCSMSSAEFISQYVPTSYLEIDTAARVIRLDSFSKTLAPGLRLGYIVAHKAFIEKIKLFITISTKHPSGASQALLCSIYESHFGGFDGWVRWLIKLSREYSKRKQVFMSRILESHLVTNKKLHVLEPSHGMFVTVQFNFASGTNVPQAMNNLEKIGLEQGIVFVLGTRLTFDEGSRRIANFARLALSPVETCSDLVEGATRFIKTAELYFEKYEGMRP